MGIDLEKWENYAQRHRGAIFAVAGGVAGILQAWQSRGALSPDLLNYLALARALLANGWNSSINGFWSPMYSWLLAIPMYFHVVTPSTELLWVHIVNLGVFLLTMLCFHFFLNQTLRLARLRAGAKFDAWVRMETRWYFVACAVFLFAVFEWLPNATCTPDLLVAAFIFLSAGLISAVLCRDGRWANFVLLGQALALGYLAKAPAFPLALLFFVMVVFLSRGEKWRLLKCAACAGGFVLIAGPFLYTLSKKEAHLTFGESGRVNYLMYADGLPAYWLGEVVPGAAANYKAICADLPVYAFRVVPKGLFYPAIEPSRWYAGLVPYLNVRQEAANLRDGYHTLGGMVEAECDLLLGFVLLLLVTGVRAGLRSVLQWWFLWVPAACGVGMFWLVHVEERFIVPFLVLAAVGVYSGVLLAGCRKWRIVGTILLALLLTQGGRAAFVIAKGFLSSNSSTAKATQQTIADLEAAGVPQGSKVALIGNPIAPYWAWMGQYLIVGELPASGVPRFLGTTGVERERVYGCLAQTHAEAVLIHAEIPEVLGPGWKHVGPGDLYVRRLDKESYPIQPRTTAELPKSP